KDYFSGATPILAADLADDCTYYYPTSQQTPSSLPFPLLLNPHNSIKPPPPFIIQLIPPPTHETITKLEQAITQMQPLSKLIEQPLTPQPILNQIFAEANL
ncbi:Hsp33 family molecular chaperone HslO, partial [Staphylococcus epidermidis]|uniref:Hsp33 family molecular chaperone HslO n=1 Tax=Staphylococcus epidermidis TaxID=1282 RepID=UPI0016430AB8